MRILSLALLISTAALPALAQQAAPPLRLRTLTWPGKVERPIPPQAEPAPAQSAPTPQAAPAPPRPEPMARASEPPATTQPIVREARADLAWKPAYRPVAHGASHMLGDLTPAQAQAVLAQRAAQAAETDKARGPAPAQATPALPASIYAPPPVHAQAQARPEAKAQAQLTPRSMPSPSTAQAPTRLAAASPYDQPAHYYSLHRAFGEQPDPVTLSPQFLSAASPDLADPPPPPPPRILPGQTPTAAQLTAARQQQSSDSSGN